MLSGAMIMERLDGEPCASLLRAARRQGAVTLLDTVFVEGFDTAAWQARLLPCLEQIDYFAPSLPEARALTGLDEPGRVVDRLLEFGARNVVLKLDAEGALLATKGGRRAHLPAYPVEQVVDSTGAGDSFCAGFLAGLATGRPPFEAARLGNAVAHHCIQARGATAGVPTLALADAFLERGASGTVPTDVT
jgi:sugar/nucleoside kinase (ribokinase family)